MVRAGCPRTVLAGRIRVALPKPGPVRRRRQPQRRLRRGALRRRQHRDQQRSLPPPPGRARARVDPDLRHPRLRRPDVAALCGGRRTGGSGRAPPWRGTAVLGHPGPGLGGAGMAQRRLLQGGRLRRRGTRHQADDVTHADPACRQRRRDGAAGLHCPEADAARRTHHRCARRTPQRRRIDGGHRDPRGCGLRLRRGDSVAGLAATQRLPAKHRPRSEVPPHRQGGGALQRGLRPRSGAHAPRHRIFAVPHHRRLGQFPEPDRARGHRVRPVGVGPHHAASGRTRSSTTQRSAAPAREESRRCPASERRS